MNTSSFKRSYQKNCFREHIHESIVINKERKKIYSRLSSGKSDKIFNFLIASEYTALAPAAWYDLRAQKFHKQGMDLFACEFMSMDNPGAWNEEQRNMPDKKRAEFPWKIHKERISAALKSGDAPLVGTSSLMALIELGESPHHYPMTRHLIESIYRFAFFLPLRVQESKALGISSPESLMIDVMKFHLLGFPGSYEIDEWCAPLHDEGLPVLMLELPDLLADLGVEELKK